MNRRRVFFAAEAKLSARVRSSFLLFFDQTVPLVTIRAAAQPLGRLIAAALTGIDDFDFSHSSNFPTPLGSTASHLELSGFDSNRLQVQIGAFSNRQSH